MAKSLQCPACGARTRLDDVSTQTFNCTKCGRVLKVPAGAGASRTDKAREPEREPAAAVSSVPGPTAVSGGPAAPVPEGASVSSGPGAPPVPRRRRGAPNGEPPDDGTVGDGKVASIAAGDTAVVSSRAQAAPMTVEAPAAAPAPARSDARSTEDRDGPTLAKRVVAWVIALPIALVAVGLPARKGGFLTGQRLLDVIVKHNLGRFVPLVVIVALWALVSSLLVTAFLDGGRWLAERRARRQPGAQGVGAPPRSRGSASRGRRR